MSVDGEAVRLRTEADEPGWEVDPDDEWGVAVIATVGRQLRLRREAVGMRAGGRARRRRSSLGSSGRCVQLHVPSPWPYGRRPGGVWPLVCARS